MSPKCLPTSPEAAQSAKTKAQTASAIADGPLEIASDSATECATRSPNPPPASPSRRRFIGQVGVTGALTLAGGAIVLEPLAQTERSNAHAAQQGANQRANTCAKLRRDAAQAELQATPQNLQHPSNNDEALYANKAGSYSKGLPHNADGTVNLSAYQSLVTAINSRKSEDFDAITLGGTRKLINPQAGLAFDLEGADSHALLQPAAPAFSSKEEAAEIAENYWMALLRDVPYTNYPSHPTAIAAAADLTNFGAEFTGPKESGAVTPKLLFRGLTQGDKVGPHLSQFFYLPCFFGANEVDQQISTAAPFSTTGNGSGGGGRDYGTTFSDWLNIQNGVTLPGGDILDPVRRYMRMGRDIGHWVHIDVLFQGYFQAFLLLAGLGAPFDDGNPYNGNPTQEGFGTFGGPHIATLLCEVSTRALKSVWYQKWFVHRRLRPEEFAGRVERNRTHPGSFDIHASLNSSSVLPAVSQHNEQFNGVGNGTYLLPLAFPEGSPTHPAYGAGHGTVAGACVTILKAWFNESTPISSLTTPVHPSADGLSLVPYTDPDASAMTVGGELNKVASNVAIGRNVAGVHWRSDATESLRLGEEVAIRILRNQKAGYNEKFNGFSLTKFDGTPITI